jgi:hypothetical protein
MKEEPTLPHCLQLSAHTQALVTGPFHITTKFLDNS